MTTFGKRTLALSLSAVALVALIESNAPVLPERLAQSQVLGPFMGHRCNLLGLSGCVTCPNPLPEDGIFWGCGGTTTIPRGWRIGNCDQLANGHNCYLMTMDCGPWIDCRTLSPDPEGNTCPVWPLCTD